jgi:hypothetical protein
MWQYFSQTLQILRLERARTGNNFFHLARSKPRVNQLLAGNQCSADGIAAIRLMPQSLLILAALCI